MPVKESVKSLRNTCREEYYICHKVRASLSLIKPFSITSGILTSVTDSSTGTDGAQELRPSSCKRLRMSLRLRFLLGKCSPPSGTGSGLTGRRSELDSVQCIVEQSYHMGFANVLNDPYQDWGSEKIPAKADARYHVRSENQVVGLQRNRSQTVTATDGSLQAG